MSLDLHVNLERPVRMQQFLAATRTALLDLLQVEDVPSLRIEEVESGKRSTPRSEWINGTKSWEVSLADAHEVHIVVIDLEKWGEDFPVNSTVAPEEREIGLYANVSVHASRGDPLKWVLAAACAIALARESGATVGDDALCWTKMFEQSPDDFVAAIKAKHQNTDIQEAARAIWQARPGVDDQTIRS